jgi:predicted DNA-binding protein YlxM (UPF0122 family)
MIVSISELQKLFKLSSPRQLKASFRNRIRVFDDGNAEITDGRVEELISKFRNGGVYDVSEVSALYNISESTVTQLADFNFISAVKLTSSKGSKTLFLKEDIEREKELLLHYSRAKDIKRLARLGEKILEFFKYAQHLTEREHEFFRLYYLDEHTYEEIGIQFDLSRERVRQIVMRATRRIFTKLSYFIRSEQEFRLYKHQYKESIEKAKLYDLVMQLVKPPEEKAEEPPIDYSQMKLVDFDLSTRALHTLHYADIETVAQLITWSKADLLKCRNLGLSTLTEIEEFLRQHGLSLREP